MGSVLTSAVALLVTLGVLIAFHEFGHFWVARKCGVKVLRFSIGFGKPIWMRTKGEDKTEYAIAAIPLGGYVKMLDEREGDVEEHELHRAFNRQPVSKRIAIVAAGPIFNFIFAIAAYAIMYIAGIPGVKPIVGEIEDKSPAYLAGFVARDEILSIADEITPTWNSVRLTLLNESLDVPKVDVEVKSSIGERRILTLDLSALSAEEKQADMLQHLGIKSYRPPIPALIGQLEAGGAAERDGLKVGDLILSADGKAIKDWIEWVVFVRDRPEQAINVEVLRDDIPQKLLLTPKRVDAKGEAIGKIGAAVEIPESNSSEYLTVVKYGPIEAIINATVKTWQMSVLTLRMIGKMIMGEVSVKNLSGPITIATYAGYTASIGFTTFLSFLAVVSISLGVLNLLPIPLLDGGHLLYYVIEILKGNPLSDETQLKMQQVGIVLLGMLMIVAIYNDIYRLFAE